jgi:hypothetical protein
VLPQPLERKLGQPRALALLVWNSSVDAWMSKVRVIVRSFACFRLLQPPSQSLTEVPLLMPPPPPASFRSDDWLQTPLRGESAETHETTQARSTVWSNFILRERLSFRFWKLCRTSVIVLLRSGLSLGLYVPCIPEAYVAPSIQEQDPPSRHTWCVLPAQPRVVVAAQLSISLRTFYRTGHASSTHTHVTYHSS